MVKNIFAKKEKKDFHEIMSSLKSGFKIQKEKYGYIACSFAVPLLIFLLMYLVFWLGSRIASGSDYGGGSVLVLDLNGQYVYFFEALHHILRGDASFFYSWARSLGGEFIGIYAYYLASPLSYIVGLFPSDCITEALLTIILLKCGIAGGTTGFYLKKHCPSLNNTAIVTLSSMYALSSYMIAYAHNTMWMDALMLLPLVLYGAEQLIEKGNFKLYVICLTLTLVSTFYIGYMVCLFLVFYFFYYYFSCNVRFGANNYYGEKLHFPKSLGRMAVFSAVAILCACLIILPTYYSLTFGKTTFSDPDWTMTSQFDLLEFFSQMLPGSYDTVRPDGLPFVYCGTLALVLLPLFFVSKKIALREKIGASIMLLLMVFFMDNSITDLVFHGFQRPNWLNYRYSFIFIFLVVVCCARALEDIENISLASIIGSGAGSLILIILVQTEHYEHVGDFLCIWISIVCLVASVSTVSFVNLKKFAKQGGYIALASVCCLELFGAGVITVVSEDEDVVYSTRGSYVNYMNRLSPIVDSIQSSDKSFYRMEKTVFRNVCDNMALNIRGLSNSTSTLNATTIKFLNSMGYSASSHWTKYVGGTPVSDSLLGIKYIIYDSGSDSSSDLYTKYSEDPANTLIAYLNSYALSLCYSSNSAIKDLDISDSIAYASPFETMNAIVTALLGESEEVELFKPISYNLELSGVNLTYSSSVYETLTDSNGNPVLDEKGEEVKIAIPYYFYEPANSHGKMYYNLEFPEDYIDNSDVYFFFCSNYPRKVSWSFSETGYGSTSGTFFDTESDCIQSLGKLQANTTSMLTVTIDNDSDLFYIMQDPEIFYYLDRDVFTDVMARLAEGNLVIDEVKNEASLVGSVNVPEGDSVMFTSIPYDAGWNVYVDGKKVETYKTLNSLVAFDITPGEHTVKLVYRSSYMVYGTVLTCIGALLFILFCVADKVLRKPGLASRRAAFEKVIADRTAAEEAAAEEQYRLLLEKARSMQSGETDSSSDKSSGVENAGNEPDGSDRSDAKDDN